jgi:hypothetical protein
MGLAQPLLLWCSFAISGSPRDAGQSTIASGTRIAYLIPDPGHADLVRWQIFLHQPTPYMHHQWSFKLRGHHWVTLAG